MKPSYEDFQFDTAQTDDVEVVDWDGVSDDCGYNLDDQVFDVSWVWNKLIENDFFGITYVSSREH